MSKLNIPEGKKALSRKAAKAELKWDTADIGHARAFSSKEAALAYFTKRLQHREEVLAVYLCDAQGRVVETILDRDPKSCLFSAAFAAWINNYSQSVAVDMGAGGDDPECVAEMVFTCIDRKFVAEYDELKRRHGYKTVQKAAANVVATL